MCKEANPDCILVGEMIHGNYNQWVGNDRLESGTNYQLSKAIWSSLNDHNFFELGHSLQREDSLYHGLNLVNFLGNHDVTRIASQLNNPAHYRLALSFLMLYKGIPCLYYGDEVAMEGTPGAQGTSCAFRLTAAGRGCSSASASIVAAPHPCPQSAAAGNIYNSFIRCEVSLRP